MANNDSFYWAFISYSHKDEAWARWLHNSLETYQIPKRMRARKLSSSLVKEIPEKLFPVFRDRNELSVHGNLQSCLNNALVNSTALIVICSPHSVASEWVNQEIEAFKKLGRGERIFPVIVDGEPNACRHKDKTLLECFPEAIRFDHDDFGNLVSAAIEPIAADLRPGKDDRRDTILRLVSGIIGVGFDDLKQRDRTRSLQRRFVVSTLSLLLAGIAVLTWLLMADARVGVPFDAAIRRHIDANNLSLMRPVHSDEAVVKARKSLMDYLPGAILSKQASGQMQMKFDADIPDMWSVAQGAAAILGSPNVNGSHEAFFAILASALEKSQRKGDYGWVSSVLGEPHAEPMLWLLCALSRWPQGNKDHPGGRGRELWFGEVQSNLQPYYNPQSGGWNMFRNQAQPDDHSNYSSVLALQALLDMKRHGVEWKSGPHSREDIIRKTSAWFVSQYVRDPRGGGWLAYQSESARTPNEGLSMQIFATLLRARREAGIEIPAEILEGLETALFNSAYRPMSPWNLASQFEIKYRRHNGEWAVNSAPMRFLWHPWSIAACDEWLLQFANRMEDHARVTAIRRTRSRLLVDHFAALKGLFEKEWAWVSSEELYALSITSAR